MAKTLNFNDDSLIAVVEGKLPELKQKVEAEGKEVVLYEGDFAAELDFAELLLLGMAIKYIVFSGKTIRIVPGEEKKV